MTLLRFSLILDLQRFEKSKEKFVFSEKNLELRHQFR